MSGANCSESDEKHVNRANSRPLWPLFEAWKNQKTNFKGQLKPQNGNDSEFVPKTLSFMGKTLLLARVATQSMYSRLLVIL